MKINAIVAILGFCMVGHVASAANCSSTDRDQIIAGLQVRANDQDLSAGERSLANVLAGDLAKEPSLQSCVKNTLPSGYVVYLIATSNIQSSVEFAGSSIIKVQAKSL